MPSLFSFDPRWKPLSSHSKRIRRMSDPPPAMLSAALHPSEPPQSVSPFKFSQLPVEICAEIFGHCLPEFPRLTDPLTPPLGLALVCRSWYYLVTTSPRLWSCFELVLDAIGSSQPEQDEIKSKLLLWLKRSRQQPLSFRIIHEHAKSAQEMHSVELLRILLPYSSRWQHVHFHGPGGGVALIPRKCDGKGLPALRSLLLQLNHPWNAPFHLSQLEIPWSQLSVLNLQFHQDNVHSLDECFTIMSVTKNLVSCTLNADHTFSPSHQTKMLALPYLKSLKLRIQGTDAVSAAEKNFLDFLERLSLPNLRAFSTEWLVHQNGAGLRWRAVSSRFADFLHSSDHLLEDLGLAYLPLHDGEIISYLDGLPNLRTLVLKFALSSHQPDPITNDLLQYMTPRGRRCIQFDADCPISLKTLKLQCSGEHLNQPMLLSLVEAHATKELKNFEVLTMRLLSKEFRERIRAYKHCGLNFSASTLNIR